jgi:hypothetical protein
VSNSYSISVVSGENQVGGLVGQNGEPLSYAFPERMYGGIHNCYAASVVSGKWDIGGLVGLNVFGESTDCFWDIEISGQTQSGGGEGKTTAEMQIDSTFIDAGWDFVDETTNGTEDIWWILEGQDYPRLWWERSTDDTLVLVVDDFESYNDIDEGQPGSNRIYLTWIDGWEDPFNGAIVGYIEPPFVGRTIAHSGIQSLTFAYDNSVGYSEATADIDNLSIGWDWTTEGVSVLSLWFGDLWTSAGNALEPMYVALANADGSIAVVYHNNPNATRVDTWTEWRIDLQRFADQGVDLTNINTISIGFGDKNNPQVGGLGVMYFDDIKLYRPDSQEQTPKAIDKEKK